MLQSRYFYAHGGHVEPVKFASKIFEGRHNEIKDFATVRENGRADISNNWYIYRVRIKLRETSMEIPV